MGSKMLVTIGLGVCAASAAAILGAAAQVGGSWESHHLWTGGASWSGFGVAVANARDVDGDGTDDVLVGAHFETVGGIYGIGSVYLYSGASGTLLRRIDSARSSGTWFGYDLDGAGDVDGDGVGDVIVGAMTEPPRGAAFVYSLRTGVLLHRFDNPEPSGLYARNVAGAGDVDADGFADLLIGNTDASHGGYNSGSAYLHSGRTGALLWRFDGTTNSQYFGGSLAAVGDLDLDGHDDVAVGGYCPCFPSLAPAVEARSGRTGAILLRWTTPSGGSARFGRAVAGAGDLDRDGVPDLLIGDPEHSTPSVPYAGRVHAYSGRDGSELLALHGLDDFGAFGEALDGCGDMNGDGVPEIIVGAPRAGVPTAPGRAFLFSGDTGARVGKLWGRSPSGRFGCSVAACGDLDGDGVPDVCVGAEYARGAGLADAGLVVAGGFHPYLRADLRAFSAAAGTRFQFHLDFLAADAGADYRLLGSASGTGPTRIAGVEIPLSSGDALWRAMSVGRPPPAFGNAVGRLDPQAKAAVDVAIPAGSAAAWIGRTLYFAAVLLDPIAQVPLKSSIAVRVEIDP